MSETLIEFKQREAAKDQRWRYTGRVHDAYVAGARALGQTPTNWRRLKQAVDVMRRRLVGDEGQHLQAYRDLVAEVDGGPTAILHTASDRARKHHYVAAYRALARVAADEEIITGGGTTEAPAYEYEHQVGLRKYRTDSPAGESVELVSGNERIATLLTGGTGKGKSASMRTLVEDRIATGFKVVDLLDTQRGENATYDVPQQDAALKAKRREQGLEATFSDDEQPDVEVFAPLTESLADSKIPVNPETGEASLKAFTIPASDLTYRQLVMLLPHTTKTQENYLQSAFQKLEREGGDWTLADMAETVREETNAGDAVAARIEQALRRLQQKPYIRDKQSDLTLDWERIMADVGTVTSFTLSKIREASEKKTLLSYLLDRIYDARQAISRKHRLDEFPPLALAVRELHKVAPANLSEQTTEKELERYMTDTFQDLMALMRHVRMELLCDTQQFKTQLNNEVGTQFDRVFAFAGQEPDIRQVFRTRVSDTGQAETVAQYNPGECAVVSGDGYMMPISMAPPRTHHPDAKEGEDGIALRVQSDATPDEWAPAPWSAELPPRLSFKQVTAGPIERFLDQCVEHVGGKGEFIPKAAMEEAYKAWAGQTDSEPRNREDIGRFISDQTDINDGESHKVDADGKKAVWWGVRFENDPRELDGGGSSAAVSD